MVKIEYVDDCVGCPQGCINCGRRNSYIELYFCENCGDQTDKLYIPKDSDAEFCEDCFKELYPNCEDYKVIK